MRTVPQPSLCWRRSSYSDGDGHNGNCVEVARADAAIAVRDAKNPAGGALSFSVGQWRAFLAGTW
ncbi:uncharacterized protein DUF397 [Tamaricihabitans halophyticus]|uniref:Uncharacterized protein DUF397 n=1 Tax=Tamaricihabitans halophyticus TaxID=1262583 RepID=A0A4R2R5X6_9PSEU|nr:DUF397 domain-containing protein [Tamaricihabitans halophyticus]TCP57198.1 uncharacterized protein DUF397 [Tamaricihabitans halophyticus]